MRIALKPGSLPLVREWAKTLAEDRRSEALATMMEEGVTVESYFLESGPGGDYLVAYMRADSLERAASVASASDQDIDRYHQEVKQKAWGERTSLEPLVDLVVQNPNT
jgi:hypothetical protein